MVEVREAYKGKWVIEYRELDRNLQLIEGDVIAEAASKKEIYKLQLTVGPGKKLAIEYCGEWPTDDGLMVSIQVLP